ncbi:hypothetical protein [Mesobacillus maritimus]
MRLGFDFLVKRVKIDIAKQGKVPVGTVEFLFEREVGGFKEVL